MTLRIAHRGDPKGCRENTLPAISTAVELGADMVEVDVRVTSDGEAVLLHDPTLERLWGDPREVADLTVRQLRSLNGLDGWAIPTLDDALSLAEHLDTTLMVDVSSAAIGLAAASVVDNRALQHRVTYCGDTTALVRIRERDPDVQIALSWNDVSLPDDDIWQRVSPQFFNPEWPGVTEELVTMMHSAGRRMCTWTVDDPAQMARLVGMGVDAVISNEIAELVRITKGAVS